MESKLAFCGRLEAKLVKRPSVGLVYKLRNLGRSVAIGWLKHKVAALLGLAHFYGTLRAVLIRADGTVLDYGLISARLVTTAFVNHLVDELQAATEFQDYKYHDSGVGTTAAAVGDTDIETTDGESRATGTQTEGATADIYRSVGTISYTTTKAITEHGLFCNTTGATLMDRHVFSAINVNNGDSIQFTYELTVSDGG